MKYTIEQLDNMEGHAFEYAVADLLRHNGWRDVEVTQGSGDYGIDILARRKTTKYAIQCKRYKASVGVKAVQEAGLGSDYYHCDASAVITNSSFTKQAENLANTTGVRLWDRAFVEKLIEDYDDEYEVLDPHNVLADIEEVTSVYAGRTGITVKKQVAPSSASTSYGNKGTAQNWTKADEELYKRTRTAFWLCLFLGFYGVHRFYLKKIGTGFLWLFTAGVFLGGWLVDLIKLGKQWNCLYVKRNLIIKKDR